MTSRSDPRLTMACLAALAAAFAVVVTGAATAAASPAGRAATVGEVRDVASAVAADEPGWRDEAERSFPGDHWSQRDDFHARESAKVHELAASQKLAVEQVLRAVDEDVRATAQRTRSFAASMGRAQPDDPRGARAIPCKPRPFYD